MLCNVKQSGYLAEITCFGRNILKADKAFVKNVLELVANLFSAGKHPGM